MEGGSRFDSYLLAIEAAIDGQGIAIVPSFLVGADLRSGRLVEPFGVRAAQPRRWFLVCRTEQRDQRPVVEFREWLRDEVRHDPFIDT